jgi:hypothetical protein
VGFSRRKSWNAGEKPFPEVAVGIKDTPVLQANGKKMIQLPRYYPSRASRPRDMSALPWRPGDRKAKSKRKK